MSPKALRLIQSLSQIKNAINCLFDNGYKRPALLNMFTLIDICSSISMDDSMTNAARYKAYLKKCMMPKSWDVTLDELWSARCFILIEPMVGIQRKAPGRYFSTPAMKKRTK